MALEDMFNKYLAPWEDSPGKGSRDVYMQDATGWGQENLGKYLWENEGDPWGVFDPNSVSSYLSSQKFESFPTPDDPRYGTEGYDNPSDPKFTRAGFTPSNFTGFTPQQLQSYLTTARENAPSYAIQNNDVMWMPEYKDINGRPMVSWGAQNSKDGFLDKVTQFAEPLMMSLFSPFAGPAYMAGAGATGAALEGAGAFGGEAFGAAANSAGAFGGSVAPWAAGAAGAGIGMPDFTSGVEGLAGTAGDFGLGASDLGVGGLDLSEFARPFDLNSIFDFPPTVGGYGNLSGYYPGDFTSSMLPGGANSPFGSAGGGMIDLSGGGMGSVTGTGMPSSFLQDLMSRFGNQKDLLKLGGSLVQNQINKKNNKQMMDAINQSRNAGFPFQNYQYLAQMWADPNKRYEMLQNNPAYRAAADYVKQAQMRRNAKTGDLDSGFGAATLASVLGQNAAAWDKQQFDQIAGITGMGFNNNDTTSRLAAALYPAMGANNVNNVANLMGALRANQGFFPDMLKTFFA